MFYFFLISVISSIILGGIFIPALKKRKVRQSERIEGPQSHLKKEGTPTMGGLFVILAIILTYVIAYIFKIEVFMENIKSALTLLIFSLFFAAIGFIDDYFKVEKKTTDGIRPKSKMLLLIAISVLFVVLEVFVLDTSIMVRIPFIEYSLSLNLVIYLILSVLVILSMPNAVNLTDGIDGLASSVGLAILFYFFIVSILNQRPDVAIFTLMTMGAYAGFLVYNWHKAKIFMGDTGSFFLGGLIGLIAIVLGEPLYLFFIAIIPLIETLSVIIQVLYFKKTGGKRVFKMTPYHHHLELSGWKEETIVLVFTAVTMLVGTILLLFKIF